jgi:hypothetical protein
LAPVLVIVKAIVIVKAGFAGRDRGGEGRS